MADIATLGAARAALADSMIRVDIEAKYFGKTQVLGPIRFEIAPGETVALVGRSGIGKSTLLNIVAGIDTRFQGSVDCPDTMAIVFQEPTLLPWRSALDNLLLPNAGLQRDRAMEALDRIGLTGREDVYPGQLSLGQQRRLALARAFVGRPQLLLMDEPFVSLDADIADSMMALTEELIAETGPATLFVTHARTEAERLADRILVLSGTPASLQRQGA